MMNRLLLAAGAAIALAGCRGSEDVPTAPNAPAALSAAPHHGLPVADLARARLASARYRDVRNAVADGYVDINVVLPNMGRHFLKRGLLDSRFEVERPELLVYSPGKEGHLRLVAVEYAVPFDQSSTAPEGFRGSADNWFADHTFKLWTLHAWVWKDNPDGVFHMTNRRVP